MLRETYGVEKRDEICKFIFLIRWTSAESIARFKNPYERSSGWMTGCKSDWWERKIIIRLSELETRGARVMLQSINFHTRQQWPFQPRREEPLVGTKVSLETEVAVEGLSCGMGSSRRSCNVM
jgi:hypothetical protein